MPRVGRIQLPVAHVPKDRCPSSITSHAERREMAAPADIKLRMAQIQCLAEEPSQGKARWTKPQD